MKKKHWFFSLCFTMKHKMKNSYFFITWPKNKCIKELIFNIRAHSILKSIWNLSQPPVPVPLSLFSSTLQLISLLKLWYSSMLKQQKCTHQISMTRYHLNAVKDNGMQWECPHFNAYLQLFAISFSKIDLIHFYSKMVFDHYNIYINSEL